MGLLVPIVILDKGTRSGRRPGESPPELQVVRAAGEHLRGIERVRAAVPGKQGARGVAAGGVELLAQDFAADGQSLLRIAQRGKKLRVETGFAGDLPHHLHQAPGKAARVGLRRGDFVIGVKRRDVFGEKRGLITDGPGIPRGLLLDDSADESGIECSRFGGMARKRQEL